MKLRSREIRVLHAFRPYLRYIKAYDCINVHDASWRHTMRSIFDAFILTLLNIFVMILLILGSWDLFKANVSLRATAISLPILYSVLQMQITFIALIANNQAVSETIDGLQKTIQKSELFY